MGRILCSITDDTVGWHDPLGGCSDAALVAEKYGECSYQQARNAWHQNALDGFLIEIAKYGLGPRDLMMNINFFSKVEVLADGTMHFVPDHAPEGSSVELRAEMNTLVILNSCQHPMDPSDHVCAEACGAYGERGRGSAASMMNAATFALRTLAAFSSPNGTFSRDELHKQRSDPLCRKQ